MELSRCHFAESARRSFFVHPTNLIPPRYFSSGPFLDLDRRSLLYIFIDVPLFSVIALITLCMTFYTSAKSVKKYRNRRINIYLKKTLSEIDIHIVRN